MKCFFSATLTLMCAQDHTFTDVSNAGFSTTLGVASFREPMQNKVDLTLARSLVRRGRPFKVCLMNVPIPVQCLLTCFQNHTGLPGRPPKALTLPRIQAMEHQPRVPKRKRLSNTENEESLGSEIPEDGPRRSKRLRA